MSELYLTSPKKSQYNPATMPDEPRDQSHALRNAVIGAVVLGAAAIVMMRLNDRVNFKQDVLTPTMFTVKAGSISSFPFTVYKAGHVYGRFQAMGGESDDIQAVITDADTFEHWKGGQAARVMYQSDKTKVGRIDVAIPPGQYFLAFNNRFSAAADKIIAASILLNQ